MLVSLTIGFLTHTKKTNSQKQQQQILGQNRFDITKGNE
jgi:hypothetical protein